MRSSRVDLLLLTTLYLALHSIQVQDITDSDPVTDKWEVQLRKGCLELAILAALWSGKRYGLEVLRCLESDSDLIVSEGTVYPLLSRLKTSGLVQSEWVESDAGHPRKYYALTTAGRQRALEMARIWERFSSSMSRLLTPLKEGK
jgi:PadR family transcriptional regulator PadR